MKPIDHKIVGYLEENARMSNSEIARKIGVSEGAVRKRIAQLHQKGIIKKFTIETVGVISAIVGVLCETHVKTSSVVLALNRMKVIHIYEVTGRFDIICYVKAENTEKLNELLEKIRAIEGVQFTETFMVLKQG